LHNATKCAAKIAAVHKTGKPQCYRIQQYTLRSNTLLLNFSEATLPSLLLLLLLLTTTTTKTTTTTTTRTTTITYSKLIKIQEEINGVIEELLEEEEEMDIRDINNLIYAAATVMIQTLNEPNKKTKIEEM
jgi:hypothetical protein